MTRSPEQTFLRHEIGLFSKLLSRIQEKIIDKQLDVSFVVKKAAINKKGAPQTTSKDHSLARLRTGDREGGCP
jgi:hypothetical protein